MDQETPELPSHTPGPGSNTVSGGPSFVSRVKRRRKQIAFSMAIATTILALGSVVALLPFELVHLSQNIINYFDKRLEHTVDKRMGVNYKAVFDEYGNPAGFEKAGNHPLRDAYKNYSVKKLADDMKLGGVEPIFNSRNRLTGFKKDGETIDLSDSKIAERRSFVGQAIRDRYPELGFIRRNLRTRAINTRWGIRWKFLENLSEKVDNTEAALTQKLKEKLQARVDNTDGPPSTTATEEDKAKQEAQDAEGGAGDAEGTSGRALASTSLGIGVQVCAITSIAKTISDTATILRQGPLMRFAFTTITSAQEIEDGQVHASQVNVFMKRFSGFANSGAFKRITGHPNATVTDRDKFSLDGNTPAADKIASVGNAPGISTACSVISNTPTLVLIAGGALLDTEGGFLSSIIKQTIGTVVFNQAIGAIIPVISGLAVGNVSKDLANATPTQAASASISGYDAYSNTNSRSSGGYELSAPEVTALDQEATHDEEQSAAAKGLAYALFSPHYSQSVTSRLADIAIPAPDTLTNGFNKLLGSINPFMLVNNLATVGGGLVPQAQADSGDADPAGFGGKQYGLPDALLDKYPDPLANEDWIVDDLAAKGQQLDETPDPQDLNNGDDDYHRFVKKCLISDDPNDYGSSDCTDHTEEHDRFRVYRLDTGIGNMIMSFNTTQDDQNQVGYEGGNSSQGGTATGGSQPALVAGSAQTLAKNILDNNKISKSGRLVTQDLQATAAGQDATANAPLNPALLAALASLGQSHSFDISALESGGTGHCDNTPKSACPSDPHYQGDAADIGSYDGTTLDGSNAASNQLQTDIAAYLPDGARFGMAKYPVGSYGTVTIGGKTFHTFNDSPDHDHVDVLGASGS